MLHHVALEVRPDQADAEVAFWALLGFPEVPVPETLAGRSRWVQHGDHQVHLLFTDDPVRMPEGHVAVVGDAERLRASGLELERRATHWGADRHMTRSPAGHRVEVMAFPPG